MRSILTVSFLSLLCVSLQAQLFPDVITFNALRDGVHDVAVLKKELIINGFTKITKESNSSGDTYAFGYNEDKETATIWVGIRTGNTSKGDEFSLINVTTFGHSIYDNLVEDITDNCKFVEIGENDQLIYNCGKTTFSISSSDGSYYIGAMPNLNSR